MNKLFIDCEEENFDVAPLEEHGADGVEGNAPLAAEIEFVDGEEIRRLNRETRNKDAVTDVLSFPSLDGIRGKKILKKNFPFDIGEDGEIFIGSIAICEDRAKEQAEEYGHSYNRELHYLIVHGLCHLLGYDHIEEADKKEMREKEERILGKMGITRED